MSSISRVRDQFPILSRRVHGKRLVYLDNGATTQKPVPVLNAMRDFYETRNANVHRGIHTLSAEATESYEGSRSSIADFIGARAEEIVFTRGTTESFNMLAGLLSPLLKRGDEILLTEAEHHSNMVPWQQLALRKGLVLKYLPYSKREKGIDFSRAERMMTKRTRLVSVTQVSNVLGSSSPLKRLGSLAHDRGAFFAVDAAQGVARVPLDVRRLPVDFLAFSGHKMYGPTGIGVLFGRSEHLESLEPVFFGGEMVGRVEKYRSTWNKTPWKFEAGTPPIAEAIGLRAAVRFIERLSFQKIRDHEKGLLSHAQKSLEGIPGLEIYGPPPAKRKGVLSFNLHGVHSHDVATILDGEGVAVRAGHHCAMPLAAALGISSSTRASVGVYNSTADIDALVKGLERVRGIFRGRSA